jgi:perosamine synthetase
MTGAWAPGSYAVASRTQDFEREMAAHVGAAHAVAFASARAAFAVALEAMGLSPGDEVITSVGASPAATEAICDIGGRPVLVDVLARMLTLDPTQIGPNVTPRTRIVLPVHAGGIPCDMDAILALAAIKGLRVVEDGREALGAQYRGRRVGAIGDVTVMAADPMSQGAVVLTTDRADYAAWFRRRHRHVAAGCRMREARATAPSTKAATAGLEALAQAERARRIRAYYADLYWLGLADVSELTPPVELSYAEPAHRSFIVHLHEEATIAVRDQFLAELHERMVDARSAFVPLYARPRYAGLGAPDDFPRARAGHARAVALPLDARMTEATVWHAIAATRGAVAKHRRGEERVG